MMSGGSMKRRGVWMLGAAVLAMAATGSGFAADAAGALNGTPTIAQAAEAPKPAATQEPGWHFTMPIAYYGFNMKGTVGIRNFTSDVDLDRGDVSDLIDKAFGVGLDFGKGKWSGIASASYLKFENESWSGTLPAGRVEITPSLEWTTVSGAVTYRAYMNNPGPKVFSIEPLGGVRYNKMKATLEASGAIDDEKSKDVDWEDLFAGFRMIKSFTQHFGIVLTADYGVGVSGNTEPSYNIAFTGGWRFPFEGWSMTAFGGYKWQNVQYEDEDNNTYTQDLDMSGPTAGVAFSW